MQFKREPSSIASRHKALGSVLEDWNGMGTAWSYNTDTAVEHDGVRESAGLFDVSGLKKVWLSGPDATTVVNHLITRDINKIYVGKAVYSLVLTLEGTICDDAIIYRMAEQSYLIVHGTGYAMERLQESAEGKDVEIEFDDSIQDISLQGPKALDILNPHTPMNLAELKYFHQQETTLFGHEVIISRTGYSGEKGYEIYAKREVICDLWDNILAQSCSDISVIPCSFNCLDIIRIEAGLLFYPYDMNESTTPWEVGLGWCVDLKKDDFRGKTALLESKGKEKIKLVGLSIDGKQSITAGDRLLIDSKIVGEVRGVIWSHRMNKTLSLAHIKTGYESEGNQVIVESIDQTYTASIEPIPFYDPEKIKPRS